jgi:branched-chain amino acid transport system substrate-binding protein
VAESTAGCYALQLAIEKANSLDPKEVRDALVGLDAQTFYGQIKFDESGKNIYKPMAAEQWQGDKKVTVWPEASAPAPAKYPTPPWNQR